MTDDLWGRQTQHLYHLLSLKLLGRQELPGMVLSILHVYLFPLFSASRMYRGNYFPWENRQRFFKLNIIESLKW